MGAAALGRAEGESPGRLRAERSAAHRAEDFAPSERPAGVSADDAPSCGFWPHTAPHALARHRPGLTPLRAGAMDQVGVIGGKRLDPIDALVRRQRWRGLVPGPVPALFGVLRAHHAACPAATPVNAALGRPC